MSTSTIALPSLFAEKLSGHEQHASALHALTVASQIMGDPTRGLPFFPEYTDHGTSHFQRVLDASASILNDAACLALTAEDAYVLTCATLLHDIAMHLTDDGLIQIVTQAWRSRTNWKSIWSEYIREVERWPGSKLFQVLGNVSSPMDANELAVLAKTPIPLNDPGTWTQYQRQIMGEFVRRHHATLAQEFAEFGFPGTHGPVWIVAENCRYAHLCGFVARSHHMKLRDTYSTLRDRYHSRAEMFSTRPVLLMSALRVADYLDIRQQRTPAMSLSLRTIRNPISRREWEAHQAIVDVRVHDDDSEALYVMAEPKSTGTYLRLRELFDDLQRELDMCWASLGEVFSRRTGLQNVGIAVRRITTNLDDDAAFRRTVSFVPKRFGFRTDDAALLAKLVGPLYEDRVEVGVRELLQNSIDATNELMQLTGRECPPIRLGVRAVGDGFVFEIEDFGIGMSEEVLENYFLTAGASFRDSDAWKKDFVEDGYLTVLRSGRFGIGALAAFLLGERITVTTRHHLSAPEEALTFSASIDDPFLEVRKFERASCGTTISINIAKGVYDRLVEHDGIEWDWYRWSTPRVERYIDGNSPLANVTKVPMPGDPLPPEWHELKGTEYESVLWTHGRMCGVACNGITIGSSASSLGYSRNLTWDKRPDRHDFVTPVARPKVSVADKLGVFPLSLQRFNTIGHALPFRDALLEDVTKDFIAFSLTFAPERAPHGDRLFWKPSHLYYPGDSIALFISFIPAGPWFYSSSGCGVQHTTSLRNLAPTKVSLLIALDAYAPIPEVEMRENQVYFFGSASLETMPSKTIAMILAHSLGFNIQNLGPHPLFFTTSDSASLFICTQGASNFAQYNDGQVDLTSVRTEQSTDPDISVLTKGNHEVSGLDVFSPQVLQGIRQGLFIAVEISDPGIATAADPVFDETWSKYMVDEIIPYDLRHRESKFERAYGELTPYLDKWKALQVLGQEHIRELFRTKGLVMHENLRL